MHRTPLKTVSAALFAALAAGVNVKLDKHRASESVSASDLSRRIVAPKSHRFRIRTITAGVNLRNTSDLATVESAIVFLQRAKKKFEDEGYEIQTLRIATQPLPEYLNGKSRAAALADLKPLRTKLSRITQARETAIPKI